LLVKKNAKFGSFQAKKSGVFMPLSLICASHTPMMDRVDVDAELKANVSTAFATLADHYRAFNPDIVIQFSPDHYQGFFHRLMPSICVGTAAKSAEDWSIPAGDVNVPEAEAKALMKWLLDDHFDIAFSRDMVIDHGFLQMWEEMLGTFSEVPVIPVFINCAAPPLPRYQRIRELGESVGRFAQQTGKRVLIVASGGLSHDAPVPDIDKVPPEIRERLIKGTERSAEEKEAHQENLTEFGRLAAKGEGPCMPLNPEWDQAFLDIIVSGQLDEFDAFTEEEVRKVSGRAANEVLCWVAACSALATAGDYKMEQVFYYPIPAWIAGMAMVTAQTV
jgi:2,3-dihydroxyphenylpropionate 1,2-dioxygenase